MEWHQTYGGASTDAFSGMIQTTDGGFALAGWSGGDAWLVKTNAQGVVQWNRTYGGATAYAVIQMTDGGFTLTGTKGGNAWLVKTNTDGTLEWQQTYGGAETDYTYAGIQTTDGGFVLAGYTRSYGAGLTDAWLVKTDAQGGCSGTRRMGALSMIMPTQSLRLPMGALPLLGPLIPTGRGSGTRG